MRLQVREWNCHLRLILLLLCVCGDVLPENPYKSGEVRADNPKGCAYLRCKRADRCVNRKFWCRNPPCPSMLYCSKSRKESLKGPSSCEAVRCSKGFVCLVRVRRCRWNEPCEQQIARCVSERDYYDGPATCADFKCPSGLRCILRESLCAKPPCKLVKSCANPKDVKTWHDRCKSLGCLSEHECFLRRECPAQNCKHTPDCSAGSEEELEANEQCRGWVCPKGEECSAHTRGPCEADSCKVSRSCHKPLMVPLNVTPRPGHSWRDDVKLSFFAKLDDNSSIAANGHSADAVTNKITRAGATGDRRTSVEKKHGENRGGKAIHGSPNSRTSPRPDITSGRHGQPTVTSLTSWLDHLRLKTGLDAIEAWIKKAEKTENYGAFLEWLDSVKDMLGPTAYDLWLEEVRTMTVTRGAFHEWLPRPASVTTVSPSILKPANENHRKAQGSPESPKSTADRNDDDKVHSERGSTNISATKNGTIKIDDRKEESYVFPPKNDTPRVETTPEMEIDDHKEENYIFPPKNGTPVNSEINVKNNPVTTLSGIPTVTPAQRPDEWRPFYDPGSRLPAPQIQYPMHQPNFGNYFPWSNQAQQYAGFDGVDPRNSWYQQFQQTPGVDSRFPNPINWQSQLSSLMTPQRNQMDRRYLESDHPYRTNWSFQQPPNADVNYFYSNDWPDRLVPPQRDANFAAPGFSPGWSFRQPQDSNGQFLQANNWQGHFGGPSLNPQQALTGQTFLDPDNFPYQQLPTSNWSFQQPLNGDPSFLRRAAWQPNSFSPQNPQWQPDREARDQFNRRTLAAPKLPVETLVHSNGETLKYSAGDNSTETPTWVKYFLDQTSQLNGPREQIGSFPIDGENVGYESWPGPNYQGRSPSDVPHRRTKHEDSSGDAGHGAKDHPGGPGEIAHRLVDDSGLFVGFPWLVEPRLRGYYLRLRDQYRTSSSPYVKNYRELPPASSSPSRTHRLDGDTRSPGPNPFLNDDRRDAAPRLQYQWPSNSYQQDRPYGITRLGPGSFSGPQRPAVETRANIGPPDPFPKVNRPDGDGKFGFAYRDFDAPGQPMGVSDLWNAKFRSPLGSVPRRVDVDKRKWGYRDVAEKERSTSTTTSPPVVPTLMTDPPHLVMAITSKNSRVENYDYDDEGIYPLLLSLQGYIETSKEDGTEDSAVSSKNLTILPVYKVEDEVDDDADYSNDYDDSADHSANVPSSFDDEAVNVFKNVNYGGSPDFPDNLESVFDVEATMILENTTGESGVEIKDIKWVYDDDDDDDNDDEEDTFGPSSFFVQSQDPLSSGIQEARDPAGSDVELANADAKRDYYDVTVDYEDRNIPGDGISRNFQQPVKSDDAFVREAAPDDLVDSFDDDQDHRRFKKNRP